MPSGVYIRTDKYKKESRTKRLGTNNPNYKGGKPKCIDCGKLVSNYGYKRCRKCWSKIIHPKRRFKKGDVPWNKGKKNCVGLSYWKNKKRSSGSKACNWKGGLTSIGQLIRTSPKYQDWKQQIFLRDNFTCQKCGQFGGYLNAHHKKSFSKLLGEIKEYLPLLDLYEAAMIYSPLWDLKNGVTLCKKCHSNTQKK